MRFIFPQNYDFKNKLLGIIDYSTAIFNVLWSLFIFCFINLIFHSFKLKLFIFITLSFPVLLFSIIGFNHENILYVCYYIIKFYNHRKIYIYK